QVRHRLTRHGGHIANPDTRCIPWEPCERSARHVACVRVVYESQTVSAHRSSVLVVVWAAAAAGCMPLPPPAMPLEGVTRQSTQSTTVRGYVGYAGEFGGYALTAGGRVSHQVARNVAVGGEGVWAGHLVASTNSPNHAFGARAHGVVWPNTDHLAFSAGVGM